MKQLFAGTYKKIFLGILLVLFYFLWELLSHPDVRSYAIMANCKGGIKIARDALKNHISVHGDLPRTTDGKFDPAALICGTGNSSQDCVRADAACCSLTTKTNPPWRGLVWCDKLSKSQVDLLFKEDEASFVVLCHETDFLHLIDGKRRAPMLLSNGRVTSTVVDKLEYRQWLETEFRKGNLSVPAFVTKELESDP